MSDAFNQADPSTPPIALAWAAAWNERSPGNLAALFSEDAVYEDLAFQVASRGRQGVAQWVEITASAMPDVRVELLDAFQAGDHVAIRWMFRATPKSIGMVTGTGKGFAVPVATLLELDGEKISRASDYYNLADLLRQVELPADIWTPPT